MHATASQFLKIDLTAASRCAVGDAVLFYRKADDSTDEVSVNQRASSVTGERVAGDAVLIAVRVCLCVYACVSVRSFDVFALMRYRVHCDVHSNYKANISSTFSDQSWLPLIVYL